MDYPAERFSEKAHDARDQGIASFFPADWAQFIRHPDLTGQEISASEFRLEFELENELLLTSHITADNRYEWYLDGRYAGMGPDRCGGDHWSFASYKLKLGKGKHVLSAMVWFSGKESPHAQLSMGPGFLFAVTEEEQKNSFNTGKAPWKVRLYQGFTLEPGWGVGHPAVFDCAKWADPLPFTDPVPAEREKFVSSYGEMFTERRLFPSDMPEQMRDVWKGHCLLRTVLEEAPEDRVFRIGRERRDPAFQDFLDGKTDSFTIPPKTERSCVIDFEEYLCAYARLTVSGGRGGEIAVLWYESAADEKTGAKGDRNVMEGKVFGKTYQREIFRNLPGKRMDLAGPWWRSGRYVILSCRTAEESLTIEKIAFEESRYPLEEESQIDLGNAELEKMHRIMFRALQNCAHETYIDCPYYEQLMYVADTRLEILATAAVTHDARLPKRSLDLFAWSRAAWDGFVAERYPTNVPQLSATFTMIYPLAVRDFLMNFALPPESTFRKMRGIVRSIILVLEEYVNKEGILENLPGWSFIDWPVSWKGGVPPPGENKAPCSVYSLLYLLSLAAARELEKHLPEEGNHFDAYLKTLFDRTSSAVKKIFWCPEKALFADDREKKHFSTHAQSLALIAGILDPADAERCIYAVRDSKTIVRPTISFIFYWFEALKKYGFGDWIYENLASWKDMARANAVTTWETEDPTRSDCHGWGAHLLYHYYATFAGIRSTAPGFQRVSITPSFGPLSHISGRMVHPEGFIEFDLVRDDGGKVTGKIVLPGTLSGKFACGGHGKLLNPGINVL